MGNRSINDHNKSESRVSALQACQFEWEWPPNWLREHNNRPAIPADEQHEPQDNTGHEWDEKYAQAMTVQLRPYTVYCSAQLYRAWCDAADAHDREEFDRLSEEIRRTRIPRRALTGGGVPESLSDDA